MNHRGETLDKMERFRSIWGISESLKHAHELAETGIKDTRNQNRFRRNVERHFDMVLETPNSKLKSPKKTTCPSTLDLSKIKNQTRYVVTCCINDSGVDEEQLNAYQRFCEAHDAQLIIIPQGYLNVSAMSRTDDYAWPEQIFPYVLNERHEVDGCAIDGRAPLQATAVDPLSGMEPICRGSHTIFGHPQYPPQSQSYLYSWRQRAAFTLQATRKPRLV